MTDTQPVNPETEAQGTPAAEVLETPTDPKSTKKESAKPSRKKAGDAEKLAALEEKLAEAEQKQGELQNSLMRTAAEYDNYRKRSQKEQESAFGNGVSHAANALLPVLDTLNAAATADTARIGEVVEYSGMSRQTIHNYTIMGLLPETQWTQGGHRLYDQSVFGRLDRIARLKAQRKSMQYIREFFVRFDSRK